MNSTRSLMTVPSSAVSKLRPGEPSSLKRGSGKVRGAYTELYFLDHVTAREKYLVLTDLEFFDCFTRETRGRLGTGLPLLHCPLPEDLCREIASIRLKSRGELRFDGSA